jgi:hypothetical protein
MGSGPTSWFDGLTMRRFWVDLTSSRSNGAVTVPRPLRWNIHSERSTENPVR